MKSPTFEGKSCNTFPKIQPSRQPIENPSPFGKVLLEFLGFQQQIKMPLLNKMKNPQQNLNPTKLQSIYIENFDMKIPTTQPPNAPMARAPNHPDTFFPRVINEALVNSAAWEQSQAGAPLSSCLTTNRAGWSLLALQIHSNHRSWRYFLRGGGEF